MKSTYTIWDIDNGPYESRGPRVANRFIWWNNRQHFVYFGLGNCCNRPSLKLYLSDTWLLSYQLGIPIIASAMFAFWIYHFPIFYTLSLFLKPLTAEGLYTPANFMSIVNFYCRFPHPHHCSLSCGVSILSLLQLSCPLRGKAISLSLALIRCKPGEKFIRGCSGWLASAGHVTS